MATPSEKLAASLEALKELQDRGTHAIRSANLSRTHRERLVKQGFLFEVMKGWYIPSKPDTPDGDTTVWYASFWDFCAAYLTERFGSDWCICPDQSISLLVGNETVPQQLVVHSPRGGNNVTALPHGTSLLDLRVTTVPKDKDSVVGPHGLRLHSLPAALIGCSASLYTSNPTYIRAALLSIRDASDLLETLLDRGQSVVAGRLAGAMRNVGQDRVADDIVATMGSAGYNVRESDPFETMVPTILMSRGASPWVNRLHLMWHQMRDDVIDRFPTLPGLPVDPDALMQHVEDIFITDAYHSLSIEGYRVSIELIEKVHSGQWNPETNKADKNQRDALAARGYWQAFQSVKGSLVKVLRGENPGTVADDDHGAWYREMFGPSVTAGLLRASDLAGYRNDQVYIRGSMHVPPNCHAVRDLMPAYFNLLRKESKASVRAVLGHFFFGFVHPYMDGNGRMARFLMNLMLASGGYPWTVVPVERRKEYMAALEDASVKQNVVPFAAFLADLVAISLASPET